MKEWYVQVRRRCDKCRDGIVSLGGWAGTCIPCNGTTEITKSMTIKEFMDLMDDVRGCETLDELLARKYQD